MFDYTTKLYSVLRNRAAYVQGATEGKFGMNPIKAENLAKQKYPMVAPLTGELPEIAEAMRVPAPDFAPRNEKGEDIAF